MLADDRADVSGVTGNKDFHIMLCWLRLILTGQYRFDHRQFYKSTVNLAIGYARRITMAVTRSNEGYARPEPDTYGCSQADTCRHSLQKEHFALIVVAYSANLLVSRSYRALVVIVLDGRGFLRRERALRGRAPPLMNGVHLMLGIWWR